MLIRKFDNRIIYTNCKLFWLQESSCESVILRDINRTFPAHDFFKETGGLGQDSLYRISKAYAVYDEEVGYCQGLSFLVASLLLHVRFRFKLNIFFSCRRVVN